jgi:hypothetical protein
MVIPVSAARDAYTNGSSLDFDCFMGRSPPAALGAGRDHATRAPEFRPARFFWGNVGSAAQPDAGTAQHELVHSPALHRVDRQTGQRTPIAKDQKVVPRWQPQFPKARV